MMHAKVFPDTVVEYSRVGIRVRYAGPTNTRGSRWLVSRSDGKYKDDPDRVTMPYQAGLGTDGNVVAAVEMYLKQKRAKDKNDEGWPGRFVIAACDGDEYIATWTGAV